MFLRSDQAIASGTGFVAMGRLVTNNHVIQVQGSTHVAVRFVGPDGYTETARHRFTANDFSSRLLEGDGQDTWDFAVIDISGTGLRNTPNLEIAERHDYQIGMPVAFLGYQFSRPNLALGTGFLASRDVRNKVRYLQLDASINQGNSGGPVLDPVGRKVIGIVTRRETGLSVQFDQLRKTFDNLAGFISQSQATIRVGPVDVMELLLMAQHQLKGLAEEIHRSANVGIGFAYETSRVAEALTRCGIE